MLSIEQIATMRKLPLEKVVRFWAGLEKSAKTPDELNAVVRMLCLSDLFYLLTNACRRVDMLHPWVYDRVREVEANPDGHVDLWARGHFKSSTITFGLTIQDILKNPEVTFGIFSHTRPIAKAFLRQIMREFEGNLVLQKAFPDVLWGQDVRQAPKWALASDTPVLTTKGWKAHGELAVGDRIYGSAGQEITVLGNSGPMEDAKCLRVVFDDCELIASSEHLWPVQHKYGHTWSESEIRTMQTDELRVGRRTDRMLPTPIIQSQPKSLPVDPYILGLWLGDGTAGTNIISMHRDDELECLEQFSQAGYEAYVHRRKEVDNFSMYGLLGLKEKLDKLGCLRIKKIPEEYLFGSQQQRLSLLQGLMDSDGTCKKEGKNRCAGMCMFSNTNPDLANGVFHLASSLGMRPSILNFMPKSVGIKRVYHVYFVGVKSNPPFRSARKLALCKEKRHMAARYLRAIEPIPSVMVNCIKVDAPDSLYLAGMSMVPTHNSEDEGIIVKRKSNPPEGTVEAWGLIDGQPTSKHFKVLLYDDIVVEGSVTTPEMIEKTMKALEQSYNLANEKFVRRFAGTRWHFNDAYRTVIDRKTAIAREHPGTDDGTEDGQPVFWSAEMMAEKRRDMGPHTFSAQILLNPKADALQGFKREWLRYYTQVHGKTNNYIMVDAASSKKKGSDYTAMCVVGLASDGNYYILDMVRDRLSLTERVDRLFELHRKWKPLQVRYEKYGAMADIEHIETRQEQETYRFKITEVGGQTSKRDRIGRLLPLFEQGRIYLPMSLHKANYEKVVVDLVRAFIEEEYIPFPVGIHDDFFDSLARILEPELPLVWPKEAPVKLPMLKKVLHRGWR